MNQPTPDVSFEDVERVVARGFPVEEREEIHALIRQVDVREKPRVVLACLKNSGGDIARLRNELGNASGYWRETISKAEYPNYEKKMFRIDTLSEAAVRRLYEKDRAQYQEWLHSGLWLVGPAGRGRLFRDRSGDASGLPLAAGMQTFERWTVS